MSSVSEPPQAAQQLVANYVQMSYPLIRWLESITPRRRRNHKQLVTERLYWAGTYECVQQLAESIVGRHGELDTHTVNEVKQQSDDIRDKWNSLTDKSIHVVMDVDADDNSVTQVYVEADKPIGRVAAFEPLLFKYSHEAKWTTPSPELLSNYGSEGYATQRSKSNTPQRQPHPQRAAGVEQQQPVFAIADVSSSQAHSLRVQCNTDHSLDESDDEQQNSLLQVARLLITDTGDALSRPDLDSPQRQDTDMNDPNQRALNDRDEDPYALEKTYRISGKRRSGLSPPPIRHEVGPHTPRIYRISDIRFTPFEDNDAMADSGDEQLSPRIRGEYHSSKHISRKQKFRIDGKMDAFPRHDPEEWYEVDSGYDMTPEGLPLTPQRSRSNSPQKRDHSADSQEAKEKSEPLLKQAKELLSDTGAALVVSVPSFRRKKTTEELETSGGSASGQDEAKKKRKPKGRRSTKNFTFWRTKKTTSTTTASKRTSKTEEEASTSRELAIERSKFLSRESTFRMSGKRRLADLPQHIYEVQDGVQVDVEVTEDSQTADEQKSPREPLNLGRKAKDLFVDTGIVLTPSFRRHQKPEVEVRTKSESEALGDGAEDQGEEEIDLKTSSLRRRRRKSGRKYAFWRYKRAMEKAANEDSEHKEPAPEREIPSPDPLFLSRESTFRVSGKRKNQTPHGRIEVTGGIQAPRSRSGSPSKRDEREATVEAQAEVGTGERISTAEKIKSRLNSVDIDFSVPKKLLIDTGRSLRIERTKSERRSKEDEKSDDEEGKYASLKRSKNRTSGHRFNYFWRKRQTEQQQSDEQVAEADQQEGGSATARSSTRTPRVIRRESTFRMSGKRRLKEKPRLVHEVDAGLSTDLQSPTSVSVQGTATNENQSSVTTIHYISAQEQKPVIDDEEAKRLSLPQPEATLLRTPTPPPTPIEHKLMNAELQRAAPPVRRAPPVPPPTPPPAPPPAPVAPEPIPVQSIQYVNSPDSVSTHSQVSSTASTETPRAESRTSANFMEKTKNLFRSNNTADEADDEPTPPATPKPEYEIDAGLTHETSEPTVAVERVVQEQELPPEVLQYVDKATTDCTQHEHHHHNCEECQKHAHKIIIVKEIYTTDRRHKFRISGKKQKGYRYKSQTGERREDENEETADETEHEKESNKGTLTRRMAGLFAKKQKAESQDKDGSAPSSRDASPTREHFKAIVKDTGVVLTPNFDRTNKTVTTETEKVTKTKGSRFNVGSLFNSERRGRQDQVRPGDDEEKSGRGAGQGRAGAGRRSGSLTGSDSGHESGSPQTPTPTKNSHVSLTSFTRQQNGGVRSVLSNFVIDTARKFGAGDKRSSSVGATLQQPKSATLVTAVRRPTTASDRKPTSENKETVDEQQQQQPVKTAPYVTSKKTISVNKAETSALLKPTENSSEQTKAEEHVSKVLSENTNAQDVKAQPDNRSIKASVPPTTDELTPEVTKSKTTELVPEKAKSAKFTRSLPNSPAVRRQEKMSDDELVAHRLPYVDDQLQPVEFMLNALNEPLFTRADVIDSMEQEPAGQLMPLKHQQVSATPTAVRRSCDEPVKVDQRSRGIDQLQQWLNDPDLTEIGSRPSIHKAMRTKRQPDESCRSPALRKNTPTPLTSLLNESKRVAQEAPNSPQQQSSYAERLLQLLAQMVDVAEQHELSALNRRSADNQQQQQQTVDAATHVLGAVQLEQVFMNDFMDCWQVRLQLRRLLNQLQPDAAGPIERQLVDIETRMDSLRSRLFNALKHRQSQQAKVQQLADSFAELEQKVQQAEEEEEMTPLGEQLLKVQECIASYRDQMAEWRALHDYQSSRACRSPIVVLKPLRRPTAPTTMDLDAVSEQRQLLLSVDEKLRWIEYVDEAGCEHATVTLQSIDLDLSDARASALATAPSSQQPHVKDLQHQLVQASRQFEGIKHEFEHKRDCYEHLRLLHFWCHCASDALTHTRTVSETAVLVGEVCEELPDRAAQAELLRAQVPTLKLKPIERNRVRDKLDRTLLRLSDVRRLATARHNYLNTLLDHSQPDVSAGEQLRLFQSDAVLRRAQQAAQVLLTH